MNLPFSKAVESQGFLFLSGEVPLTQSGDIPEGIAAQTELVFNKITDTLAQYNLGLADLVSVTVYLTDKDDFSVFNEIYQRYVISPYPVRTTVLAGLVIDAKVEISVIAQQRGQSDV